jgi:hypothetical protein
LLRLLAVQALFTLKKCWGWSRKSLASRRRNKTRLEAAYAMEALK